MSRKVIAIDVDDVLADSTEALRLEVNKRRGVELSSEHYKVPGEYWGYYERVWHDNDVRITMAELNPQMVHDQSHVLAYNQAFEVLTGLSERYELVVVTAREPSWETATHRWLNQEFPGLFSQVLFAGGKTGLRNKSKGQLCVDVGASFLIDDNVEQAKTALERNLEVILFGTYGWHQNIPANIVRCNNWIEVKEYFDAQG